MGERDATDTAANETRRDPSQPTKDGGELSTQPVQSGLASPIEIFLFVLLLGMLFAILFGLLFTLWPQDVMRTNTSGIPVPLRTPAGAPVWETELRFFGAAFGAIGNEVRLFTLVILAGFLGSLLHVTISAADYIGNRVLGRSWLYWYLLRLPVGAGLAVVFYLLIRGGVLTGSASSTQFQPYGIVGISALAGFSSKQATDKLRELFETLFPTRRGDSERADKLVAGPPVLEEIAPDTVEQGTENVSLVLRGRNFRADSRVRVGDDRPRVAEHRSDTELAITLRSEDLSDVRTLNIRIETPGPNGGVSESRQVRVRASDTNPAPTVNDNAEDAHP